MATVPINEMSEITITISKYMALFITTLYINIKPIVMDAIKSSATILSLAVGPFTIRTKASAKAINSMTNDKIKIRL